MTRPLNRERPQTDHDRDWVVTAFWVNARRAGLRRSDIADDLDNLLPRQLFQRYNLSKIPLLPQGKVG